MGIFFKSKKQKEAEQIGPSLLRTAQECADRVNTTSKPETFFQNYDKMIDSLSALAKIQYSLKIKGQLPSDILRTIKDKKPFTIEEFLARYYQATKAKLAKQTDFAHKEKIIQRFAADLQPYLPHFAERNKKQLQTYVTELTQENKIN
ncbi:MAG: hypothetical protein HFI72_06570 [Peptococcaceae bacterium]|jgi:hypothetical protein|nr:hypothetical protein [Peptococcaceae bacterium]